MMRIPIVALLAWLPPTGASAYTFLECMELGVPRRACVGAVIGLAPDSGAARKALETVVNDHLYPAGSWPYGALQDLPTNTSERLRAGDR